MPRITFDRFDLGIDLRKGASVSDANRLREMKNAYVTTGLAAAKRPGLRFVGRHTTPNIRGMFAAFGKLNFFHDWPDDPVSSNPLFAYHRLETGSAGALSGEHIYAEVFAGKIYCAAPHNWSGYRHHYLDGANTLVTDSNCPRSNVFVKTASKMFSASEDGDVVRYCKTGNARDWSAANDAGFLPTGMNARGDRKINALGIYQSNLVAFTRDSAQIWSIDPDPSAMRLIDTVENVGTSFPRSVANVGGDIYFLSDYGFRSITTLQYTNNLADVDIGSPIDKLVQIALKSDPEERDVLATYFYGTGQYVCAIGRHLFVYSSSRTSKISAWSQYFLPDRVIGFAELGQSLYIQTSYRDVFALDSENYTDDGQAYEVLIDMPYMDFKSPGALKRIYAVDLVVEGRCEFSIGYDVRDPDAYTPVVRVKGNTRPSGLVSVECVGTEFSLRIRNFDDKPFRLDAVTVYYDVLDER